jgi:hypothetical protein
VRARRGDRALPVAHGRSAKRAGEGARGGNAISPATRALPCATRMERDETPLGEQLEEIGTQLDWVRGYL